MALLLHQATTGLYLLAAIASALAVGMASPRSARVGVGILAAGFATHTAAWLALHALPETPSLTSLPLAVSLMAWVGTGAYLLMLMFVRGSLLVMAVAPLAFAGAFFASVALPGAEPPAEGTDSLWSHLHVLLASSGLALVGLAAAAGLLYDVQHRAIKAKRRARLRLPLPPLEALDRVNTVALLTGFVLLTLGLLSGVAWVEAVEQRLWPGTLHANATLAAWAVYAVILAVRYGARLGAHQAALSSASGFALLLVAVVGVRVLA